MVVPSVQNEDYQTWKLLLEVSPHAAKRLLHLYMWARQYPVTDGAQEAEVDTGTTIGVYQWLREVCPTNYIRHLSFLVVPS